MLFFDPHSVQVLFPVDSILRFILNLVANDAVLLCVFPPKKKAKQVAQFMLIFGLPVVACLWPSLFYTCNIRFQIQDTLLNTKILLNIKIQNTFLDT